MSHQMLDRAMIQFLDLKEFSQPTVVGFDGVLLVPGAARAVLEIGRRSPTLALLLIRQGDGATVVAHGQIAKHIIWRIRTISGPIDYLATVVHQLGQLDTDNPAPVRLPCLANMTRAAAFPAWVDQLNAIDVHDREEGRVG
jgi:hypothetical protein